MPTIVEYSDVKRPVAHWPRRIVSPTHASPCCLTMMEVVGHPHFDGVSHFQYKVCRRCGFAVKSLQSMAVPEALFANLQLFFGRYVVRGY